MKLETPEAQLPSCWCWSYYSRVAACYSGFRGITSGGRTHVSITLFVRFLAGCGRPHYTAVAVIVQAPAWRMPPDHHCHQLRVGVLSWVKKTNILRKVDLFH